MTSSARKTTKPVDKAAVLVSSLIPPFKNGDWITVNHSDSLQFLPKDRFDRRVIQIGCVAEFVGYPACQSGWQLFGVDSGHFRKATPHDIRGEMDRIDTLISAYKDLWKELHTEYRYGQDRGNV